jgi:fatty acid desaturase
MHSKREPPIMREPDGVVPNSLALAYAVTAQIAGLFLISRQQTAVAPAGILLTAHSMVIAAYLVHECAHMTLFRARTLNRWVGELMAWIAGAAYASFERIRHFHIRHHRDRADVARFDYKRFLQSRSRWVRRLVYGLEWVYIPAVELIMHGQVLVRPFVDEQLKSARPRVLLVLLTRAALFLWLYSVQPWSLLWFTLAYLLFVTVMNFGDAFHHTFDQYFVASDDEPVPMAGKDRDYEQRHTYSNLVSSRHPWLNLLALNFGYHNAHHERASVPWYRLPALHRELYADGNRQLLPYRQLWRTFRRNRLARILDDDYGAVGDGEGRADGFVGAHGVSFLTVT